MLFVLCLIATTLAFAQKDLNSSQLKLRTEIFNFLKEEGFAPEIDKDGDIKFKRQGNYHYVIIAENNESPMYVEMERYVAVPEKYSDTSVHFSSSVHVSPSRVISILPVCIAAIVLGSS